MSRVANCRVEVCLQLSGVRVEGGGAEAEAGDGTLAGCGGGGLGLRHDGMCQPMDEEYGLTGNLRVSVA